MSCLVCQYKDCKPYANSLRDDPNSLCPCGCHGQAEVEEHRCPRCGDLIADGDRVYCDLCRDWKGTEL